MYLVCKLLTYWNCDIYFTYNSLSVNNCWKKCVMHMPKLYFVNNKFVEWLKNEF
jgi:hypothetical protein